MIGTMTIGAAGVHANEYVTENLQLVKDAATEAWNEYSPEMKQNFIDSINSASDRYSIGWQNVMNFFNHLTLDKLDVKNGLVTSLDSNFLNTTTFDKEYSVESRYAYGRAYTTTESDSQGYLMTWDGFYGSPYYVFVHGYTKTLKVYAGGSTIKNIALTDAQVDSYVATVSGWTTANQVISFVQSLGVNVELQLDGVNLPVERTYDNPDYGALRDYLTNPELTGSLDNVYYPEPTPYSLDGQRLTLNDTTGTLDLPDGTPYTGDYTWEIPTTGVTTVEGVDIPTTTTLEGDVVNIITGEVVIPSVVEPPIPPSQDPTVPKGQLQDFLPIALALSLLDLLRAILYYLARLFNYLLTLPLISSTPIPNEIFQWFREVELLGIEPYGIVISLATFMIGFTVFKVVRRVFT